MHNKSKHGNELSMNMIIMAALGLLVLLLLAFFFMGGASQFSKTQNCETTHNGKCSESCPPSGSEFENYVVPSTWSGCSEKQVCCTKLGG